MKLEELPATPLKAELVQTEAKDVRGLDLLGLRAPAEGVAVRLLDGVTTITPTIRYLSLRSWIILRYLRLDGLNDWRAFTSYAAKVESAIAYASALAGDTAGGIVGRDLATSTIQKTDGHLTLARMTKILAVSVYAGPSQNLGLGGLEGDVPGLTKERGLPLAEEFERLVKHDDVLSAITAKDSEQVMERDRLTALGSRLSMARPSAEEHSHLLRAIFPPVPRHQELPRIASYCLLLHACKSLGKSVKEEDVFDLVSGSSLANIPGELHTICDGWTRFLVRDLLVLLHEGAVFVALNRLAQAPNAEKRQSFREVIGSLLDDELDLCFAGLGLDGVKADQPIRKLYEAVADGMGRATELRGLRRWDGGFREVDLLGKGDWTRTPMGLALLPVGWIIACRRFEPAVMAQTPNFDLDGQAGISRMGVGGVLLPEEREWQTAGESVRHVVGWLLKRSVDQHLRIAWSRLAREPHKDVSLLRSDGDEWILLKNLRPGRATSRIYQALNWLKQLELVDDTGITSAGEDVLEQGLATLRQRGGIA